MRDRFVLAAVAGATLVFSGCSEPLSTSASSLDLVPSMAVFDDDDDFLETVQLDTRLFGFDSGGAVLTTNPLESGEKYRITVEGNWSAWTPGSLATGGCPAALPVPVQFGSPSVPLGTLAGVDFEFLFASIFNPARCVILTTSGPIALVTALFSLDAGATFFDPVPINAAFNTNHIYEYIVTGTGQKAAFFINDSNSSASSPSCGLSADA